MARDLTTGQIADKLAVAPRTVAKWIDSGQLRGYRLPGTMRHRRVQRVDLLAFLTKHEMPVQWLEESESGAPRV